MCDHQECKKQMQKILSNYHCNHPELILNLTMLVHFITNLSMYFTAAGNTYPFKTMQQSFLLTCMKYLKYISGFYYRNIVVSYLDKDRVCIIYD